MGTKKGIKTQGTMIAQCGLKASDRKKAVNIMSAQIVKRINRARVAGCMIASWLLDGHRRREVTCLAGSLAGCLGCPYLRGKNDHKGKRTYRRV
jgi:hypothetical protein